MEVFVVGKCGFIDSCTRGKGGLTSVTLFFFFRTRTVFVSKHGIFIQKQSRKQQFQSAHLSSDCHVNSEMESMGLGPCCIGFGFHVLAFLAGPLTLEVVIWGEEHDPSCWGGLFLSLFCFVCLLRIQHYFMQ